MKQYVSSLLLGLVVSITAVVRASEPGIAAPSLPLQSASSGAVAEAGVSVTVSAGGGSVVDAPPSKSDIKKMSKNGLKEDLGCSLRDALHTTADLVASLAELQGKLAAMQRKLFDHVERLLDNEKPYEKATRIDLHQSVVTLRDGVSKLGVQLDGVERLSSAFARDPLLGT